LLLSTSYTHLLHLLSFPTRRSSDLYNNLLDGPTSSQFEKWNATNVDFSQTLWDDRVGVQLTYDRQKYKRGGQNLITNPTINIDRSEEHTSELQSRENLVCRLLLEKK